VKETLTIVPFALKPTQALRMREDAESVIGRNVILASPSRGGKHVCVINDAISSARADFFWVSLHSFRCSPALVQSLMDGMRQFPSAGAAVGLHSKTTRPISPTDKFFTAAWALNHQGHWQVIKTPVHACSLLLRRRSWECVGRFDERFEGIMGAWIDYSLRLSQSGTPAYHAYDALSLCGINAPPDVSSASTVAGLNPQDKELLIDKWCFESRQLMDSLLSAPAPTPAS